MSLGNSPRDSQETSPLATVDRMARVERQSVKANIRTIATRLDEALRAVMTLLAQALKRAKPEVIDIAVMRLNVIADRRRCDDAALCAILTQRVLEQLVPSDSSPASRGVPLIPLCLPAANTHRSTYHPPAHVPSTALCRKVQCRTDGRTHPDTTHAWTARCSRLISAGKANIGNVIYKSFSASSRNSSGTDRATDPYPTASHPKRSRIMSTARSAVQRAIPLLVPGLRFSSSSPSGSSKHFPVLLKMRHGDRQQRYGLLLRVIGERCTNELLGDFSKRSGR